MNKEQFLEYLEIYGADVKRWPEGVRSSAESFFRSEDLELKRAIKLESTFDSFLDDQADMPEISVALEAKLIDLMPMAGETKSAPSFIEKLKSFRASKWMAAGLISASLVGGASVGYAQAAEQAELSVVNSMLSYASADELSNLDTEQWLNVEDISDE